MPAVFESARAGAPLYLGKQPATEPVGHVAFSDLRRTLSAAGLLPKPPHIWGHGHDFAQGAWLMLGNGPDDTVFAGFGGCGDCAWADPAHSEMESARNAGRPVPKFSGKTVVREYSAYSGYDPKTGANDNGSNMQDVIRWRQEKGIRDDAGHRYKIGRSVSIEPGNLQHLWEAAWLFEAVSIGISVTEAQMDQFDASPQPTWDYVPGSPELGGHAVPVVGKLGLISWGEDVYYTPRFIEHQMDEGFCYIDPLRYSAATGKDYEGFADADLERYITMVARSKLAAAKP